MSGSSVGCSSFHFLIRLPLPLLCLPPPPSFPSLSHSQRQSCGKCSVKSATSSQSAHKIVSFVLLSPLFASPRHASVCLALVWHWRWLRNQLQSFELLLLPSWERESSFGGYLWPAHALRRSCLHLFTCSTHEYSHKYSANVADRPWQ